MFWQRNKLDYKVLVPPIKKPFNKLSITEANSYLEWHISNIPERVEYLSEVCAEKLGINRELVDLSSDSLIYIWDWFLRIAEIEKTPQKKILQIKKELMNQEHIFLEQLVEESKTQFSMQTEFIIRDIGMYLGEVFILNNNKISWGYHSNIKQDSFANMPILIGFFDDEFNPPFQMFFEPNHMIHVQASNIFDNTSKKEDLYLLYKKWLNYIPKSKY